MVGVTDAKVTLSSGYRMPLIAFGTAAYPLGPAEAANSAIVKGIEVGYRHFDTAAIYGTEQALGDAIAEALELGIIKSREELFITSKLWICDTHHDRVELALRKSLRKLKLEYLDLYLVHWPMSSSPSDEYEYPVPKETFLPSFDLKSVWEAMEECQSLGLTKSIGVSNLSCKKLVDLLSFAKIPPAVNEVELHPVWQQKKLREFCKAKGIVVTAYSVLGAKGTSWGTNLVMDSEILHKIAEARGKSVAQVVLRWAFEQDVCVLVKSFNEKRMKENLEIFDWALREEELKMISEFTPQSKANRGEELLSENGPYKSLDQLWDGEIDCYSN